MSMKSIKSSDVKDPIATKQSFRDRSDVNRIVSQSLRGTPADHINRHAPVFADVSEMGNFQEVALRVKAAENAFAELPAKVRARFSNRPAELVAFVSDSANYDEAVKLGLIVPKVVKEVPPSAVPPSDPKPAA